MGDGVVGVRLLRLFLRAVVVESDEVGEINGVGDTTVGMGDADPVGVVERVCARGNAGVGVDVGVGVRVGVNVGVGVVDSGVGVGVGVIGVGVDVGAVIRGGVQRTPHLTEAARKPHPAWVGLDHSLGQLFRGNTRTTHATVWRKRVRVHRGCDKTEESQKLGPCGSQLT